MSQEALPSHSPLLHEIPRPRLNTLLEAAIQAPLSVVQAGAGFGKTRAVAGYLSHASARTVWLSFTPLDNAPARFWENLTATFALHRPALAEKMKLLGFPETQQAFDTFLSELTSELYQDDRTVVFVFDDLHLITEAPVLGFLYHFITARLENNCILLITRLWPVFQQEFPLSFPLLGPDDLRFTLDETRQFFGAAQFSLSEGELAEIHDYCAGWPIALSMVLLFYQSHTAAASPITTLSASKPKLFSLFEREIFSQYTPAEQALLVKLSSFESFPRGLVQAVSGEQGRDLGQLMASNIFIQYDATARRFYFHPLYLEYLREKLFSVPTPQLNAALEKAAAWCRENGHYYDAINYYRKSGNHQELWVTLQHFDAVRHTKPEAEFIIQQIHALPPDFRRDHPMTRILLSVLLLNNLRFDEAVRVLDEVQAELESAEKTDGGDPTLLGECYAARGLLSLGMEKTDFQVWFRRASELLPQGSGRWGNTLRLIDLGPGLYLQNARAGELKKSLSAFIEGVPYMSRVLHGAGQGLDKLCECEALFLTGDFKEALDPAYQALYSAQAASQFDIVGNALFMLLRLYILMGDYPQILDTLEHIHRYEKDEESANLGIWEIAKGWLYTEVEEVEQVALWIRNPVQHGYPPVSMDRALLVRLRCLIAESHYPEALALLEQFEGLARIKSATITLLYIELGRAVTHNYLGNYGPALDALKAAYALAKGNKIFTPFIEYGNRTRSLLERARSTGGHGIPQAWLDQTHARASTFAKRHAYLAARYKQEHKGLRDDFGLSRREVELLDNLGQGLTREEISESMSLRINTVKSMLKQVFAKLGAINSADAIRIAVANKII